MPPDISAKLRSLRAFEDSLGTLEGTVRGASAPDFDNVWNRKTDGASVIQALLEFDRQLIERSAAFNSSIHSVTVDHLSGSDPFAAAGEQRADVERLLRERQSLLRGIG